MIIVKIKCGLGNQLFQYALGRSLARRLGRQLYLDTTEYGPQRSPEFALDKFMLTPRILGPRGLYGMKKIKKERWTLIRKMARQFGLVRIQIDAHRGFDETVRRRAMVIYLDGYWQSELYFAADREFLLKEFTVRQPVSPADSSLLARLREENSVGVHIRRGDYVATQFGAENFAACGLDYYHAAMAHISDRARRAKFYLFSDDPAWVRDNFRPAENLVIVSGESARSDVEDFRLMMNCRHFIIANSTFSWWAAWLGRRPDKIVVAPQRWYCSEQFGEKDLVPERWVRL